MRRFRSFANILLAALLAVGLIGCNGSPAPSEGSDEHEHSEGDGHDHGDEHAHPSEGPHHGSLIELGNEEYHAELVHNEESGTVTIYLLDGHAEKPVAIIAPEITINVTYDGQGSQFKLPAVGATGGKAAEFASSDPAFAESLDTEGAEAQLVVTINGKQYRGSVAHDHEHDH
ncbi:hypothetical protein [Bremerella alba]|uniref:Lipoprotein n=1 Tax=Bremerella alba TaxID=980252 RepID=A0A7V8V735_9BACT|nr:hypothetical protein [Bremerella alba]MBA2116140.1 hypothetical protein [Bremerella alba]